MDKPIWLRFHIDGELCAIRMDLISYVVSLKRVNVPHGSEIGLTTHPERNYIAVDEPVESVMSALHMVSRGFPNMDKDLRRR